MNLNWFAHILVHHPYVILLGVAVFSGTCLVIPFTLKTKAFLDFSDPQLGFQTRGTIISKRLTTWKNLVESTGISGQFIVNPKEFLFKQNISSPYGKQRKIGKKKKNRKKPAIATVLYEPRNHSENNVDANWKALKDLEVKPNKNFKNLHLNFPKTKGFFCGYPDKQYVHFIVKSKQNVNLFTLESLLVLCRLEYEFIETTNYKQLCVETSPYSKKCCKPWSLANYIAALHNRTSCLAITDEDVNSTLALLTQCAHYYHNLQLGPSCVENHCETPEICTKNDAVFNILNFLTATTFFPPTANETSEQILFETMIFLPVACSMAALPYYHEIEKLDLEYEGISVVAMEFGLKNALFDECLIRDAWLMGSGALFVLLCMWLYTNSLFLTLMTIIAIIFSLGIAFFVYTLIFELNFFPFMNMLATVVVIGIGSDDAFIFCKMWQIVKSERNSSVVKVMNDTFHHAFVSMFVASLTTSAAFLASSISSVTAIRCFSIFAGIAVIANFLLMITWFPASLVVWERSQCFNMDFLKQCMMVAFQRWRCLKYTVAKWNLSAPHMKCSRFPTLWHMKERYLLNCILNFRILWLIILSCLGIAGAVIVLYYPKLRLPDSTEFQLFDSSHPFEQYEFVYKNHFRFEHLEMEKDNMNYKLPLRFVWGVMPVDNGDHLNPYDLGKLELDPSFDMSDPKSQEWLLRFCHDLKRQPFYQSTMGALLPNCFIETFKKSMQRKCIDSFYEKDRTPCCKTAAFPFEKSIFNECIIQEMADIYETPKEFLIPGLAGPKFSKDQTLTIKAVIVEYDSNYLYSVSYDHMNEFYNKVEEWMQKQLKTAPETMKNGWFISDLDFYDLQRELSVSTLTAIAGSMCLALVVLLLSTLNILTSLYAILTITCSIFVTIGILVLLGWKMNVLECVAISTAIGLTVDFSLHYSVNYRLCPMGMIDDRQAATKYALSNMAGPALMASLTTGAAGAFMMPSVILPYIQIGIFLVTVMCVSWFYATFYLGAMLALIGPENHFGQFKYSKLFFWLRRSKTSSLEHTRPVSSSLSDNRELDSLTSSKFCLQSASRNLQKSLRSGVKLNTNRYVFTDQSPSATSAITIIMADDN